VQGRVQLLDQWARSKKIAIAPKLAPIKADNAAAALELAACSGGIAATLSTYAAAYLESGRLVAPFGLGDTLPIALHIVPNQQRRLSKSAALFVKWLSGTVSTSRET
jgi:LysR family glycine cleavage system transcriptional activator